MWHLKEYSVRFFFIYNHNNYFFIQLICPYTQDLPQDRWKRNITSYWRCYFLFWV